MLPKSVTGGVSIMTDNDLHERIGAHRTRNELNRQRHTSQRYWGRPLDVSPFDPRAAPKLWEQTPTTPYEMLDTLALSILSPDALHTTKRV